AAHGARVAMARALIDLLNRDLAIHFFLQRGRRAIDRIAPDAAQVGMARLLRQRDTFDQKRARENSKNVRFHFGSVLLSNSFDMSKIAEGEWWAWSDTAASSVKRMKPTVCFKVVLLGPVAREYSMDIVCRRAFVRRGHLRVDGRIRAAAVCSRPARAVCVAAA